MLEARRVHRFDGLTLDLDAMRVIRDGNEVALEPKSFYLLELLIRHRDRVVTKDEIFQRIWKDVVVTDNALTRAITQIRKALNDDPRNPRFIETIPRVGYRFIGPIESPDSPAIRSVEHLPPKISGRRLAGRTLRIALLVAGLCIAIAATGLWLTHSMRQPTTIRAMAVLPLENLSGDPQQDYFAAGMTDELTTQLARIPNVRIAVLNSERPGNGPQKPLRQLAKELNVDAVVEGSVLRSGNQVRFNARLVDPRNDRHLWAESLEGTTDNILALEDQVARAIASHARLAAETQSTSPADETRKIDPAAHDAYLRGLYYFDRRDVVRSAEAFQKAVDADPTYAAAYAGLSAAVLHRGFHENSNQDEVAAQASGFARKAIELDPNLAEPYFTLALVDIVNTWNWSSAQQNLQKGLALNPNDVPGLEVYANYLDSVNRPDEAVEQMRRAVEIDPLSFFMTRHLGSTLYFARHYDEALTVLQRAREMKTGPHDVVDNWISWVYEKKGMYDQAVTYDLLDQEQYFSQTELTHLRSIYDSEGWEAYSRTLLSLMRRSPNQVCSFYKQGLIYTRLGDRDRAFSELNHAAQLKCFWISGLMTDPLLDSLRDDPRFRDLMARLNLPPATR